MKRLILLLPFILMACGESKGEKEAKESMKAIEEAKIKYEREINKIDRETDSLRLESIKKH